MKDSQTNVGFIGLGIMGSAMAMNLLKAGYELMVYNRSADKTGPLRQAGATVAAWPAELAAKCDVIFSCVTAGRDVLEVILGESKQGGLSLNPGQAVIGGIRTGAVVIDCSTVSPDVAKKCSSALAGKGAHFIDAPVSGGDVGAKAGTLSIMAGGEKQIFDRAVPVLKAIGKTITYCGQAGSGYTVKLCNQILNAMHVLAAAEAFKFARSAGIDLQAMLTAVSSGASASWVLTNLGPKMISGDDRPGFFIDYALKDLNLANQAAEAMNTQLPAAQLCREIFNKASQAGFGKCGTQTIAKAILK